VDVIYPARKHNYFVWDRMKVKEESDVAVAVIAFPNVPDALQLLNVLQNALKATEEYDHY